MSDSCATSPPPADSKPYLLALGVVSSPGNTYRRSWIRNATVLHKSRVAQRFVVGKAWSCRLSAEQARTSDLVFVDASDESKAGCVEKSFAWWTIAVAAFPMAEYIGKTDDDSFNHLALLVRMLLGFPAGLVYAGWPQYTSFLPLYNAGCGWGSAPRAALHAAAHNTSNCHRCLRMPSCYRHGRPTAAPLGAEVYGPYIFATGALELLSRPLAAAVFGLHATRRWIADNIELASTSRPRGKREGATAAAGRGGGARWQPWACQAEDGLVGYAVSRGAEALPRGSSGPTFVSLGGLVADAASVAAARRPERLSERLERMVTVHKLEVDEAKRAVADAWEDHMNGLRRERRQPVESVKHVMNGHSRLLEPMLRTIGQTPPGGAVGQTPLGALPMNLTCFASDGPVGFNGAVPRAAQHRRGAAAGLAGTHPSIRALFAFPGWERWRFCEFVTL